MARSRTILLAGAGIGGLTAALALAREDFRVVVLERATRLEETGAGIQLSPNALRILLDLGLRERLAVSAVAPEAIRIMRASGSDIVRIPLGVAAEKRYGAPYWVIHRGDLQAALIAAVSEQPHVSVRLGARVDDFAIHANGVSLRAFGPTGDVDEQGLALIGADGLWSAVRKRIHDTPLRFAGRTAWRAVVPVEAVEPELRERSTHLWLGRGAHLVKYPIRSGREINIVAIVSDTWQEPGWSAPGLRDDILPFFARWNAQARTLVATPDRWLKWALFDRAPDHHWGHGPVTLLGDAAHPMLPFLAQGGAMAIEDAAVLAQCLARETDPATALRSYEKLRHVRTARVQHEARANDFRYHLPDPPAWARDLALRILGGEKLLARFDWLYGWQRS